MGDHSGHRERIRRRYLTGGLDGFSDRDLLELLLFYAIPRQDTTPVAEALLARYGSFSAVLEAPLCDLRKVRGIGENAALFLKLVPDMARQYLSRRMAAGAFLGCAEEYGNYLAPRFFCQRDETMWLLCLDAKRMVVDCRQLARGDVSASIVSPRTVAEAAIACSASYVVLAHNHPGGVALPSKADVETTLRLRRALWAIGIALEDHIIVAGDDFVSLADSGLLPPDP